MLTASINPELVQVNERWTSQIASKSQIKSYPMYGIFTYIYHTFKPYSVHGSYWILNQNTAESIVHMLSQSPGQPGNPPKENSYKKSTFPWFSLITHQQKHIMGVHFFVDFPWSLPKEHRIHGHSIFTCIWWIFMAFRYVTIQFFHRSVMGKDGPRRIILSVLLVSRFVPNESDWSTQLLVVASEGVNRFYPNK